MGAYRRPSIDSNGDDEDSVRFDDENEVSNLTYEEALDSVRFGRYHYVLTLVAGKWRVYVNVSESVCITLVFET